MGNNNQEQGTFTYTYSASEQQELRRIRDKYAPPTESEDKLTRLRRLDKSVTQVATTVSLIVGITGVLILGFGMSMIMTDLSVFFGLPQNISMVVGIIVGIFGAVIASLAYPIYNATARIRRKKLAPEIIRLADELIK